MWARHRHEHIADVLRYSCAFYSSCFELYGFFFKTILSNVNVIAPFWIIFVQNGGLRVNLSSDFWCFFSRCECVIKDIFEIYRYDPLFGQCMYFL